MSATEVPVHPDAWSPRQWSRLVAGDEAALAQFYDDHATFVLRAAYRVTGDLAAAEDVVQEVFVHVWRRAVDFDPARGSLRAWLGTITHRRAIDRVRSDVAWRRRTEADAVTSGRVEPDRPHPAADDPAEQAVAADQAARVRRVLAGLPVEQQLAVRLAFFEGHSYRQVAALLGIPEGTAKSRLRLALAKLAEALATEGEA